VKKVNNAWRNYFDAALTFVDRGTFAEAPEQVAARNLVTQESLAHEDWFEGVETILTQLELADNPPVEVGLNQAQILLGIDADIEVMEETLKKGLDDVEALMNDALAPVTRERMAALQTMITEVLETVRGPVSELFDQRVEEDPTQVQATTRAKREFISIIQRRANGLKVAIISKLPTEGRAPNEAAPMVQQVYKEYQREAMPEYKGGIREYAAFKREELCCSWPRRGLATNPATKQDS
jgi:hypothetical protein